TWPSIALIGSTHSPSGWGPHATPCGAFRPAHHCHTGNLFLDDRLAWGSFQSIALATSAEGVAPGTVARTGVRQSPTKLPPGLGGRRAVPQLRVRASSAIRATISGTEIAPRFLPERSRTAAAFASASRSPTTRT